MNKHVKDLTTMKKDDLAKKETELREEILETRRNMAMGNIVNYKVLQAKKRQLARVMTFRNSLGQKEVK